MPHSPQSSSKTATLPDADADADTQALDRKERMRLRSRNLRAPDALIELIAQLAEQRGGSILGIPFDGAATSAALARTNQMKTAIALERQKLRQMEDDLLQARAKVADPAFALYSALSRLVRTKEGNALLPVYEEMKTIVRSQPRPRKKTAEPTGPARASKRP